MRTKSPLYAEVQIRALNSQILKAKAKLEELKTRRNILSAKLQMMQEAILVVKLKKKRLPKVSQEIQEDICNRLGEILSFKADTLPSPEDILDDKLQNMKLDPDEV